MGLQYPMSKHSKSGVPHISMGQNKKNYQDWNVFQNSSVNQISSIVLYIQTFIFKLFQPILMALGMYVKVEETCARKK